MDELKAFLLKRLESNAMFYLKDFNAMSHAQLTKNYGGCARSAYDFTYEIVTVNKRIATRLRGETPPPMTMEGWVVAPEDFKDKESAARQFSESMSDLQKALQDCPAHDLSNTIESPMGNLTLAEIAALGAQHVSYHNGQLTFMQTLDGDAEMHWM